MRGLCARVAFRLNFLSALAAAVILSAYPIAISAQQFTEASNPHPVCPPQETCPPPPPCANCGQCSSPAVLKSFLEQLNCPVVCTPPTATPTETPTQERTATPSPTAEATSTRTPTATPTDTPSTTPTEAVTGGDCPASLEDGDGKCRGEDVVLNCPNNGTEPMTGPAAPTCGVGAWSACTRLQPPTSSARGMLGPWDPPCGPRPPRAEWGCYRMRPLSGELCLPDICPNPTNLIVLCQPGANGVEYEACEESACATPTPTATPIDTAPPTPAPTTTPTETPLDTPTPTASPTPNEVTEIPGPCCIDPTLPECVALRCSKRPEPFGVCCDLVVEYPGGPVGKCCATAP
jgi:hypothetical protein